MFYSSKLLGGLSKRLREPYKLVEPWKSLSDIDLYTVLPKASESPSTPNVNGNVSLRLKNGLLRRSKRRLWAWPSSSRPLASCGWPTS
jgi:hypothetical protein